MDDWYPGNVVQSGCGSGLAPGERGIVNAMSRRYFNASKIENIDPKPPVLWIRGAHDLIVHDEDGDAERAPQPMIRQTRSVLVGYRREGGSVAEQVIEDAGHTPFIEKPAEFNAALVGFLTRFTQDHSPSRSLTAGGACPAPTNAKEHIL